MNRRSIASRQPKPLRPTPPNIGQLDLNLLIALDALLQERHVTRAAERVSLTQPAMSRALMRLRRFFRDDLLVRSGHEYQLTVYGLALKQPVREILELIARTLASQPRFDASTDTRHFVIAAHDYATFSILQPFSELVLKTAPGITFDITSLSESSVDGLETGIIDLVIRGSKRIPHLPSQFLFQDEWVCAVWSKHPDVKNGISLQQYKMLPHLTYGIGAGSSVALDFEPEENRNGSIFQVPSFLTVPLLLTGTSLVALVPRRLGVYFTTFADIKLAETPFPMPPITQSMFWHPRSNADPSHRWLRQKLLEISSGI